MDAQAETPDHEQIIREKDTQIAKLGGEVKELIESLRLILRGLNDRQTTGGGRSILPDRETVLGPAFDWNGDTYKLRQGRRAVCA